MAQAVVIRTRLAIEAEIASDMREAFTTAASYKAQCELERRRRRLNGLPEPEFLLNPDDIVLDWETLTFEVHGPITPEQRESLAQRLKLRDEWEADAKFTRQRYYECGQSETADLIAWQSEVIYNMINDSLPPRYRKELNIDLKNTSIGSHCRVRRRS